MENIKNNIKNSINISNDTLKILKLQNEKINNIKHNIDEQKHHIQKSDYYLSYLYNFFSFFKKKPIKNIQKNIPQNTQLFIENNNNNHLDDISYSLKHLHKIGIMQGNEIEISINNTNKITNEIDINKENIIKLKNKCNYILQN